MAVGSWLSGGMDLSQEVFEANSPYYSSIYASLDRAKQISAGQVKQAYAEATGQTYLQGQQAMSNIGGTAFGVGYKGYLQNQLQQSLNTAYDKYRSGMASDITKATEAYDTAMGDLTSGITKLGQEQGQYTLDYATKAFDYAEDMYKSGAWNMARYNSYEDYERDLSRLYQQYSDAWTASGNPNEMLDEDAWIEQNKLSEEDFAKAQQMAKIEFAKFEGLFDESGNINQDAVKTAVYDESGNFSTLGVELFDYLMRNDPQGYESYQDWLKENDEDLYLWSVQRSLLGDPSNAVSAARQLGADGVYSFMERFGGLNERQTQELFSNFSLTLDDITKSNWEEKGTGGNIKGFEEGVNNILSLYDKLGLSDIEVDINGQTGTVGELLKVLAEAESGISLDTIDKKYQPIVKEYQNIIKDLEDTEGELLRYGASAAILVAFIPGIGPALATGVATGAAISAGTVRIGIEARKGQARDAINEQKKELEEYYKYYAVQSAAIAQEMRRSIQNQ